MTKSSVTIHTDQPFSLVARYQGDTDTAVLAIVDSDNVFNSHVTMFMDGIYNDRLDRAVKAFNDILHAPYRDAYDEACDEEAA